VNAGPPAWPPASKAQLASLEDLGNAAGRRAAGACLVEGELLLGEALAAGLRPRLVAVSPELAGHAVVEAARAAGAPIVLLAQRRAERLSDREHAPGLLASVPVPAAWNGHVPPHGGALLAVLCGLQDPGNVGTLLRSARAFGASACLHAPGTADPFGPKVVRASAGAAFALPVASVELATLPALAQRLGLQLVAAVSPRAEGGRAPLAELPERCVLLLGHETRGVPELPEVSTTCVPQEPGVDSLNVAVAGSILMSQWYRARRR
jgi:RNA methyltransferase, TrmH family